MKSSRVARVVLITSMLQLYAQEPASAATCSTVPGGSELESDFNGDGWQDLPVGAPFEDVEAHTDAGIVQIFYGSEQEDLATGDQVFSQDTEGLRGAAESFDHFGDSMAAGDFNGDGFCDLAIGVPGEDADALNQGRVHVLYGSTRGLTTDGSETFTQASSGIGTEPELHDKFGWALAAHNFGKTPHADLAIAAPGEDLGTSPRAGIVHVLYGSDRGLTGRGSTTLHQDVVGVKDTAESLERFGRVMTAGNLGGSSYAELVVGVPHEDVANLPHAGGVHVFFGGRNGLTTADRWFTQRVEGVKGEPELDGAFGFSLAIGDFGNGSAADLAVGAPGATVDGLEHAGQVHILYGSDSGPTTNDELWTGSTCFDRTQNARALFGYRLTTGDLVGSSQDELAVAVPNDDGDGTDAGAVSMLRGSAGGLVCSSWSTPEAGEEEPQDASGLRWSLGGILLRDIGGEPYLGNDTNTSLIVGSPLSGDIDYGSIELIRDGGAEVSTLDQGVFGVRGSREAGDRWGHIGGSSITEDLLIR